MLIIEDGTGKADAQSYATVAELVAYAATRGIELPATEPEQEVLLLNGIEYMESLTYKGTRYSRDQALSFPRVGLNIDGFTYNYTELPRQLKVAQIQLAIDSMTIALMDNIEVATKGAIIEESVEGAVSTKYAAPVASLGSVGATAAGAQLTRAQALLAPLLLSFGQLRVGRG